jgi:hypothetical protein
MMKLVENSSGLGELLKDGRTLRQVRYQIQRYQGFIEGSGLPIPGLFRLEGSIDFDPATDPSEWINTSLVLRLEDGRALGINLVDTNGKILTEGHGPMKCMCC